ncbi:insulinase family protein, partial [Candidatus Desantisbacteria bacterium]|nr:insulinase family protein [Candidatus Desantisbacteria bacterium]
DDMLNFYNSLCTFDNMVIAVYGDINSDEVVKKINESLSAFKTEQKKTIEVTSEPELKNIKKVEKEKDNIKQALIFMGFQSVDLKNEDKFVFEIITGICSDMGGRLYTKIREEEGLAYYVGSYSILGIDPGAYVFYVGTVPEKTDTTAKKILKEIKSLQNKKVPEDELVRVKKNLIGEKAIAMQTNESQAFTDALNELYGLGYDYEYQYAEKINKVTAEDIQRVAKKYLNMDNYVQIILKPKKILK